jgi:prepilin-type N-terminal cleavage/methylation domain-containing protein
VKRGFSLIEALMAVLILGISLLGLGALLPVVAKQQRDSADQTFGSAAAEQALGVLRPTLAVPSAIVEFDVNMTPPVSNGFLNINLGGRNINNIPFTGSSSDAGAIAAALTGWSEADRGVLLALADLQTVAPRVSVTVLPGTSPGEQIAKVRIVLGGSLQGARIVSGTVTATVSNGPGGSGLNSVTTLPVVEAGRDALTSGFWTRWAYDPTGTADAPPVPGTASSLDEAGYWLPVAIDRGDGGSNGPRRAGDAVLGPESDPVVRDGLDRRVRIALADRLWPQDGGRSEPQFVWDVAVRRVQRGSLRLQAAVFVRRVDPRIRLPRGVTTIEALTLLPVSDADFRWPVSFSNADGRASLDGRADGSGTSADFVYSQPLAMPVTYDPSQPDRLVVDSPGSEPRTVLPAGIGLPGSALRQAMVSAIAQPGQLLVDNLGTVHTVLGLDDRLRPSDSDFGDRAFIIRIAAPVSGQVRATSATDPETIRHVLFTPQIPARVVLEEMNP